MKAIAPSLRRNLTLQALVLVTLTPGLILAPAPVRANPQGPNVVAGNVNFQGLNSARLDINNQSNRAIINWQSFSIDRGEVTSINQGANAFTLNRVVSGDPTAIYGQLKAAQGGVMVVNPNGIVVHQGGSVDVAGMLTLSTLDISNKDFLNGGTDRFRGTTAAGVRNYGAITSDGGDVVLLGNFLQNAGSVNAPRGVVAFGAGGDIVVDQAGESRISVQAGGGGGEVGIDNTGTVNAAAAELKAHGNVYALAIKNDGVVRASGYNFRGGRLTLSAGSQGRIVNTGNLTARNADGSGGQVRVSGGRVQIAAGTVDAAGDAGKVGGSVDVSGRAVSVAAGAEVRVGGSSGGTAKLVGTESVAIDGLVDAAGTVGSGGRIDTTASSVTVGTRASLGASGATSGGQVRIGGGLQGAESDIANSRRTALERGSLVIADGAAGNGGQVVVWSDGGTLFEGEISAQARGSVGNGGFVEVSGRENLRIDGEVSTASANGRNGTFLVDPINITISPIAGSGVTMTDATLRGMVAESNVVIHTGGVGAATGDISVLAGSKVVYDSPNSLTFLANGDIYINGDIKNIGSTDLANTGHITLVSGWDGTLPGVRDDNVSSIDFINSGGTPLAAPGRFGNWGSAGNSIFLNELGAEAVEVGSARGQTNLFGDTIQMRTGLVDGRFTQIGYRRVADIRANDPGQLGGYFALGNQIVDGAINVSAKTSVLMKQSEQFSANDGDKNRNFIYTQIGHGGIRRADNAVDYALETGTTAPIPPVAAPYANSFGYDVGAIVVDDGNNSGDITVYAGQSLIMVGGRSNGHTQIGHGGHAEGAPNGNSAATNNARPDLTGTIIGNMTGGIRVSAGFIDMEAGLYDDAPVQIGHGGYNIRGEFSGNIDVVSTTGAINGRAAPNLGDAGTVGNPTAGDWTNNRDRSYVMIGHGGSSSFHNSALPARAGVSFVTSGGVTQSIATVLSSVAGDGIRINPATGRAYGHNGNISVDSARGLKFTASGNSGFAMIGHGGETSHGDHRGSVSVVARNGSIVFDRLAIQVDANGLDRRNVGANAFVQIGHQGRRSSGGGTGDILVRASGNVEFYAGRAEAYAQIGHGGRGDDSTSTAPTGVTNPIPNQRGATRASGTHSGNITVESGGDIRFRSGFGTGGTAYSMIGHGGFLQHADIIDPGGLINGSLVGGGAPSAAQQGHNGTITVTAARDISFIAGQTEAYRGQDFGMEMNRTDNFTMIGNGGRTSWGDHWGAINVTAGRNIQFEARGGWNAITYEGTNEGPYSLVNNTNGTLQLAQNRGTPRYSIEEDDGATGIRNFAMIGNGGWDANHRLQSSVIRTDVSGATVAGPIMEVAGLASDDFLRTGVPHGLVNGDTVTFQSLNGGAGLAANNTVYFIVNATANTFQVSTTAGGTPVNFTGDVANNTRDHSGAMGAGIGTAGLSPITITAGGNVEFEAAQIGKVGSELPTRAILSKNSVSNRIVYTDVFGNPVALGDAVSQYSWYPDIVNRVQPNLVPVGTPGRGPGGESMGRLNIGVTGYRLSSDATAANQNRFIMNQGSGFVGGEIVYLSGTGVTELGLSATQAYQVFNVRVNETDFQLRTIDVNGLVGGTVAVGSAPAGPIALSQTWHGWDAPDPVASAHDSFAQIGNGGRSTNYLGGGNFRGASDGLGHRGDITINAGGVVSMKAGNFDPAVATGQSMAIRRIAYNGANLIDSTGAPLAEILVGPGAPNGAAPALSTMVGTNFGTAGTDTRSQLNPSFRLYNYGMIGSGGWTARGDHRSNIAITAGRNTAGVGLLLQAGEGREDFAQIGSGGFDADGYDPLGGLNSDANRFNDDGSSGNIAITVAGNVIVQGGGTNTKVVGRTGTTTDTTATAPAAGSGYNASGGLVNNDDSQYSYAQIGNGGALNGGSHTGNVSVVSTGGGVTVAGGRSIKFNYAQIGNGGFRARGGAHSGTVTVRAASDINVQAGSPLVDTGALIANLNVPSSLGQISHASFNYAQIGHGGFDADPEGTSLDLAAGLGGFTGDIEVISVSGNVNVRGGGDPTLTRNGAPAPIPSDTLVTSFFRSLSAHIGHGGNFTDGDHGGNVKVVAGNNLTLAGAAGGQDSFTSIGHGGLEVNGNLSGDITIVTGNNLVMNRGADTDTSAAGTTNRAGAQLFNNYTKIGHGDQYYQQRNESFGNRNGDILVSIGNTASLGQVANRPYAAAAYTRARADSVLIGHIDSRVSLSDPFRSLNGNTFIAVSRNNPGSSGAGELITSADTIFSSATEGASSQLRFYLPNPDSNRIAAGTFVNNGTYTRTPTPDGTRDDETLAVEHGLTEGAFGEPEPSPGFTPEGAYPTHGFGLYNLYYAGIPTVEPVPPIPPVPPVPPVTPAPPYDFLGFFAADTFDAFFRDEDLFLYDGYDEVLASIAYEDAMEDESPVATGGTFLEEVLDSSVGDRRYSEIEPGSDVIEDENDEELRRREIRSARPVGKGSLTYYVYNPGTNRYSSYRVFGVEQTRLSVTR